MERIETHFVKKQSYLINETKKRQKLKKRKKKKKITEKLC